MNLSKMVRSDLSFFFGVFAGGLVPTIVIVLDPEKTDTAELRAMLTDSCETYCTKIVEPGLFNMPEINGLRGHIRDGMCVCELEQLDATPWNESDQHDQEIQDWWLERP